MDHMEVKELEDECDISLEHAKTHLDNAITNQGVDPEQVRHDGQMARDILRAFFELYK